GEYDDRRLRRVEPHAQTDVLAVPGEPGNRAHFTRPCVEFIRNRRVGEGGYRDVVVDEFKYVLLTVAHVDEVEEFFVPLDPADVFEVRVRVGHRWLDAEVGQRDGNVVILQGGFHVVETLQLLDEVRHCGIGFLIAQSGRLRVRPVPVKNNRQTGLRVLHEFRRR